MGVAATWGLRDWGEGLPGGPMAGAVPISLRVASSSRSVSSRLSIRWRAMPGTVQNWPTAGCSPLQA